MADRGLRELEKSASSQTTEISRTPTGLLGRFVREITLVENGETAKPLVLLPNAEPVVLMHFSQDLATGSGYAVGAPLNLRRKTGRPDTVSIAIRIRTGMAGAFFPGDVRHLTNRHEPLDRFWGREASDLLEIAASAKTHAARLERIEAMLGKMLPDRFEVPDGLVQKALHMLATTSPDVEAIASELGLSARTLHRRFAQQVGLSPKAFACLARFRRTAAALKAVSGLNLTALAVEMGYYDQAHMIAEFHRFAGETPGTLLRKYRESRQTALKRN